MQDWSHSPKGSCRMTAMGRGGRNSGGWHYAFDLFKLEEPVVTEFRHQMEQHVQAFFNHFRPQERDYFPLQVGNQWVYRSAGRGQPIVMEVLRSAVFDGNTY